MKRSNILVVLIIVLLISVPVGVYVSTIDSLEIEINDKERIVDGEDSKYLIFTEDEVFENTDSIFFFKFNSSDFYNAFTVGERYEIKVVGLRIPVLSRYRNIVDYEVVE